MHREIDKYWSLISAIGILVLCYLIHGFIGLNNDTIETVPYAQWMNDSSLFAKDFHVQYISSTFPNERYWIAWSLHFFPDYLFEASVIYHMLFSLILIMGCLKLSDAILDDKLLSITAIIITLGSTYYINLGGNELYYNMYVSSLAGKAVAIWSFYFFYKKKYILSSTLLGIATLLHPLVGIQLFLVFTIIILIIHWRKLEVWLGWFIPYLIIGGVWILAMILQQDSGISETFQFSDIIYSRIGHHFYPALFPVKNYIILLPLFAIAGITFFRKNNILFHFIWISILGMVVYTIGAQMDIDLVLSTQWMKITIWLKLLGLIAILKPLRSYVFYSSYLRYSIVILAIGSAMYLNTPVFDESYDIELYEYVKKNTSKDDLFLLPIGMTDFKARTQRSTYFDYKAMIHHRPEIYEWARRLNEVYGIKIDGKKYLGFGIGNDEYLSKPKLLPINKLDYIVVPIESSVPAGWKLEYQTRFYKLYKV